ncbi:Orf103 [Heliothis zea nudivirus]|uniref:Orf103 n=1 Tax=Heliothis zea nudivirus 1 TaxID=3116536 RepID=Q8JKL0_9VIRU|nr:Orf103 [Heliothis zea nudivirus]AAN04397.1 Orf103 [Heliothis zea nudivirus]
MIGTIGKYFDKYQVFIVLGIAIIAIVYTFSLLKTSNLGKTMGSLTDEATDSTKFNASFFEIYDKSTDDYCDRLILVQPFNWIIVAKGGQMYALTDVQHKCPPTTTRAVKLHSNQDKFKYVCLSLTKMQLIELYRNTAHNVLKLTFDVDALQSDEKRFTILDACNYLLAQGYAVLDVKEGEKVDNTKATKPSDKDAEDDARFSILNMLRGQNGGTDSGIKSVVIRDGSDARGGLGDSVGGSLGGSVGGVGGGSLGGSVGGVGGGSLGGSVGGSLEGSLGGKEQSKVDDDSNSKIASIIIPSDANIDSVSNIEIPSVTNTKSSTISNTDVASISYPSSSNIASISKTDITPASNTSGSNIDSSSTTNYTKSNDKSKDQSKGKSNNKSTDTSKDQSKDKSNNKTKDTTDSNIDDKSDSESNTEYPIKVIEITQPTPENVDTTKLDYSLLPPPKPIEVTYIDLSKEPDSNGDSTLQPTQPPPRTPTPPPTPTPPSTPPPPRTPTPPSTPPPPRIPTPPSTPPFVPTYNPPGGVVEYDGAADFLELLDEDDADFEAIKSKSNSRKRRDLSAQSNDGDGDGLPPFIIDPVTGIRRRKVTKLPKPLEVAAPEFRDFAEENFDHVELPKGFELPLGVSLKLAKRWQQILNYYQDNGMPTHRAQDAYDMSDAECRAMGKALAGYYHRSHDPSKPPKFGPPPNPEIDSLVYKTY